jgi:hypothetical protein
VIRRPDSEDRQGLILFSCVRRDHVHESRDFTLTVHEGGWAFCPAAAPSSGHEWAKTDGVPLMDLMRPKALSATLPAESRPPTLFETAQRLSEELANAVGLRRLVLELARPTRPLILDLAVDRAHEAEPLEPALDVVLEDRWGPFGVARIRVAARERLTLAAALVALRICQDFAGPLRAGLQNLS